MKYSFYIPGLILLLAGQVHGNEPVANDSNAAIGNPSAIPVSFNEVVERIRIRHKSWQILDARSRYKESGLRYRFKLINSSGQVRIILIDPRNPNLEHLEQ